jgi:hypothetical protein
MANTSQWFDEPSTDADTRLIRRHLDRLIAAMIQTAAVRQGNDDVLRILRTAPDPKAQDEPGNPQ